MKTFILKHTISTKFIGIAILLICLLTLSCEKETIREVVPNNQGLTDTLVPNVKLENYVNKVYIALLGRKPNSSEFTEKVNFLRQSNVAPNDRKTFIKQITSSEEYYIRTYDYARASYLNNAETYDFQTYIYSFEVFKQENKDKPEYKDFIYLVDNELARLRLLVEIPELFKQNKINYKEIQYRCANNYLYDQINMGTQNFVLSMFENFCHRYPTEAELTNASLMVNGLSSVLFLEPGSSKTDMLNIFFDSKDYYEGQVNELMKRYLFRNANSVEMTQLAKIYAETESLPVLQSEILSKNEYLGL